MKNCIRLAAVLFALYLLTYYWPGISHCGLSLLAAAASLLIGAVLAYVVSIPMGFYERILRFFFKADKARAAVRAVSMLLAIVSVAAIAVFVVQLIVPELYSCVMLLVKEIPPYIEPLWDYLNKNFDINSLLSGTGLLLGEDINWHEIVTKAVNLLITGLGGVMNALVAFISATFSVVVSAILSIIFAVYLLMGKERIGSQISRAMNVYLSEKVTRRVTYVLGIFNTSFHRFIVGQCTEAVILGGLCMLGMSLFNFPYATMIGALIGFTALIPVAGAYFGAGIGAFMIFTVNPVQALLFLVFIVCLQQFEGNIIYPRVVGASIGLPGIWVLAAVTIGGGLAGIAGMLLAVPLAAALYRLIGDDVRRREAVAKK